MNLPLAIWFSFVSILAYIVFVDPNVSVYIELLVKQGIQYFRRAKFFLTENPDLPWVRWRIDRNSYEMAKLLRKELNMED